MLALTAKAVLSQSPPTPPSFLVKIKYFKVDLPATASTTCVVVLPDRRAFAEQSSSIPPVSQPRVYETSISNEEMQSLSTILDSADLRASRIIDKRSAEIAHGEALLVIIPRQEGIQGLIAVSPKPPGPDGGPLPPAILPLREWFMRFVKDLKDQKVAPLKDFSSLTPSVCEVAGKHADQFPLFKIRSR
jgi:hypothetical protein